MTVKCCVATAVVNDNIVAVATVVTAEKYSVSLTECVNQAVRKHRRLKCQVRREVYSVCRRYLSMYVCRGVAMQNIPMNLLCSLKMNLNLMKNCCLMRLMMNLSLMKYPQPLPFTTTSSTASLIVFASSEPASV